MQAKLVNIFNQRTIGVGLIGSNSYSNCLFSK